MYHSQPEASSTPVQDTVAPSPAPVYFVLLRDIQHAALLLMKLANVRTVKIISPTTLSSMQSFTMAVNLAMGSVKLSLTLIFVHWILQRRSFPAAIMTAVSTAIVVIQILHIL